MEFEHCPVPNFHKQGLVASIVILFMTCKGKRYCVGGFDMGDVGVGQGGGQIQVQRSSG